MRRSGRRRATVAPRSAGWADLGDPLVGEAEQLRRVAYRHMRGSERLDGTRLRRCVLTLGHLPLGPSSDELVHGPFQRGRQRVLPVKVEVILAGVGEPSNEVSYLNLQLIQPAGLGRPAGEPFDYRDPPRLLPGHGYRVVGHSSIHPSPKIGSSASSIDLVTVQDMSPACPVSATRPISP